MKQPVYEGPNSITFLTPASFHDKVVKRHGNVDWLVVFFAAWSPPCVHLEPVVAELSLKYGTGSLQFGKVDVGRWPHVAKEHRVVVSPTSNQLPTLILFRKGQEVGRIPHVFRDGSVAKGRFRKNDIVKGFELEERLRRSKER